MTKTFSTIWQYTVKQDYISEFQRVYASDGDWVKLFRQAKGFILTDLHQDINYPNQFISVDNWRSKKDYESFKKLFATEYQELDKKCEKFTESEEHLGEFFSL
mgnify:CR=1 FL=1